MFFVSLVKINIYLISYKFLKKLFLTPLTHSKNKNIQFIYVP